MHKRGITAAMVAVTTAVVTSAAAVGDAQAAPSPQAVPHTKPAWTAHAKSLGHASDTARVKARVYLAPRGGLAAVQKVATAVSTPGSASYHKFLTSAQYHARFDPTRATVSKVASYLRSSGLKVGAVGSHSRYLSVTGSAKAARKAFGAQINRYQHDGHTVQAPSKTLTVPGSLRGTVLTVQGLDTTPHRAAPASKHANAAPAAGFRNARPCSRYYGATKATYKADFKTKLPKFRNQTLSYAPCGYVGPQLRAAYEGQTALDGTGVTVAITDAYASPTIKSDIKKYASLHGDGAYASGQYYETKPSKYTHQADCDPSGWYGEQTLDIEAVHAMAPGAKIHYYASASCFDDDFLNTLAQVVDDNDSKLVSNSWGDVESNTTADGVAAYEEVFLQGATQGISFMFSSGDNGDELQNTGIRQADYPTSDPYVTSVGGTSTAIGATGAIDFQTGWGTEKYSLTDANKWADQGYLYGAGGGQSALFNKPDYQKTAVAGAYRNTPDVGLDADPNTGMLIGITQTFSDGVYYDEYRIGGTSLASPLFAGLTALSLQNAGGKGAGLLNPSIYSNKTAFTDVKGNPAEAGDVRVDYANGENADDGLLYSVRTFDENGSLKTTKGYDNVTGVGAPNPNWLSAFVASQS